MDMEQSELLEEVNAEIDRLRVRIEPHASLESTGHGERASSDVPEATTQYDYALSDSPKAAPSTERKKSVSPSPPANVDEGVEFRYRERAGASIPWLPYAGIGFILVLLILYLIFNIQLLLILCIVTVLLVLSVGIWSRVRAKRINNSKRVEQNPDGHISTVRVGPFVTNHSGDKPSHRDSEELEAKGLLADENLLKRICPALTTLSGDAKDISKVLVPVLAGSAAVGIGAVAFTPTIIAWMCILIARMGIATICPDHKKVK